MRCPSCGSSAILYDRLRGEYICTRCGLVVMERSFELEPEWRRRPGEKLERADVTAGVDVTQHDFGLGSRLGSSKEISPSWRARLRRMRVWQSRSRASTYGEKSLREALVELDKFCERVGLPKGVKAEISSLYRRARAAKLTAGRETRQVLAALTFITCRLRGMPRTEGEISSLLETRPGLKKNEALHTLRQLTKFFTRRLRIKLPRISADDYIDRFAPQLRLSKQTIVRAHELCKALPKKFRQTRSPLMLAAAVSYVVAEKAKERVTLRKIADTMGVGVSSLSKNLVHIRKFSTAHEG